MIPGIVGALINLPQGGLQPVELCVFLVFVAEYPFARFFFNIPAWVFGAVILGIEVIQLLGDRNERGIIFLFTSLAVAAVTARTMGLLHELPWIPALPIGNRRSPRRRTKRSRGSSSSGGGEVVAGPWTTAGRTGPVRTPPSLPQPPAPPPSSTSDQVELDALLDKISAVGMDGLDADEKRRLNELSKRDSRNRPTKVTVLGCGGPASPPSTLAQEAAGVALRDLRHLLGRSLGDDRAAAVAALGTEVDDPVGRLDDVEVVLDHEHRVALVDEALQHA